MSLKNIPRHHLKAKTVLGVFLLLFATGCSSLPKGKAQKTTTKAWSMTYPKILKAIHAPTFRDTLVVIQDTTDFRNSINKAISQLSVDGGGTIKVNPGVYKVGGFHPILPITYLL